MSAVCNNKKFKKEMLMYTVEQELHLNGILPVLKINDKKNAVKIVRAIKDGGLNTAEITFRTEDAAQAIENISKHDPDMLIGAGTVRNIEQVKQAVCCGAKFIVSPGFNEDVVDYCVKNGIYIIPGVCTPTEIERATEFGLKTLKFFPAESAGGISMLKSLASPYKNIKFMPTGGIDNENLNSYLSLENVLCCGGSWMVKDCSETEDNYEIIKQNIASSINLMLGFSFDHIGIYTNSEDDARNGARFFEKYFCFPQNELKKSIYAGRNIEFLKHQSVEHTVGHIAITTNSPDRARYFLSKNGIEFVDNSARYDSKNKLCFIYLKNKVSNFSIHLTTQ